MNRITGRARDATLIEMTPRDSQAGGELKLLSLKPNRTHTLTHTHTYTHTEKRPVGHSAQVRWVEKNSRSLATRLGYFSSPEKNFRDMGNAAKMRNGTCYF